MTKIIKILAEVQPEKIIKVVFLSIMLSYKTSLCHTILYVLHNKLKFRIFELSSVWRKILGLIFFKEFIYVIHNKFKFRIF